MKHIVDEGKAPEIATMAIDFGVSTGDMVQALKALQDYHGVVLHPVSSEVWVMHPFSTAPTNFWIKSDTESWWGNCAWCSLGAAALLDRDLTITTTLGSESKQVVIEVKGGQITQQNLFIHFPVPMIKAWENVAYTCSTMLMFESESDIDDWCERHGIAKGDVQPINKIWEFSKVWYGSHLNPDWVKWSVDEAKEIFAQFKLDHSIWNMPSDAGRF
ncbi:alkylmercury lyase family protein [bacterium SCSIO 12696]|nr:alkylmercury lyase family protein [bacterium SCSIO 12696]